MFGEQWYLGYKAGGINPTLALQFDKQRYAANGAAKSFSDILTFTRSTTATYFDASGVMQTAAIDAPRFDHDPVTQQPLGILVEGQRTNAIWNSTNTGVVAGTIGSGGALPTGWGSSLRGLSLSVETVTVRGVSCLRFRMFGTPSSTGGVNIPFGAINNAAAVNGQVWTNSVYMALQSGNFNNVTSVRTQFNVFNSSSSYLQSIASLVSIGGSLTADLQRFTATGTVSNAAAAYIQALFECGVTSGLPVDFTIVMGGCQMELGAFASSYIPTTSSAITRAADLIAATTSNAVPFSSWYNSSEYTVDVDFIFYGGDAAFPRIVTIGDGNSNVNEASLIQTTSTNQGSFNVYSSSSFQGMSFGTPDLRGGLKKLAAGFAFNNSAIGYNGAISGTDNSFVLPLSQNICRIGNSFGLTQAAFLHLREMRFYPKRVSNAELERITT